MNTFDEMVLSIEQNEDDMVLAMDLDDMIIPSTDKPEQLESSAPSVATPPPQDVDPDTNPKTKNPSKMGQCREIFQAHVGKLPRKDIIALFVSKAGCTKDGAATYYQTLTKQHPK